MWHVGGAELAQTPCSSAADNSILTRAQRVNQQLSLGHRQGRIQERFRIALSVVSRRTSKIHSAVCRPDQGLETEPELSAWGQHYAKPGHRSRKATPASHPTHAEKPPYPSLKPKPCPGDGADDWPRCTGAEKKKKQQVLNVKVRRSVSAQKGSQECSLEYSK